MQKLRTTSTIDWESQKLLSQIADGINKPLSQITRLIKHIQNKTDQSDYETKQLSSIMLESSEQIESLVEDILKIEANNRIEILVHDKLKYPNLYHIGQINIYNSNKFVNQISKKVSGNRISKSDLEWLMQLEKTILDNIDFYGLNVPWLANELATSERQIFRKIEKYTYLTPNKFIRIIKLHKAKELLEEFTYKTVNEVASAVGMRDPYYFSSLFKKEFGKKPKEYLR